MQLAPITLFVYNRLNLLQQTIQALQKNKYALNSELIIYSDGPKNARELPKVEQVRKYLKTIEGFRTVTIRERKQNSGLSNSIIEGVTEVINLYGKIIVLEDDLITSPYFLQYMNEALELYENNDQVASINGFFLAGGKKLPETFFLNFADCLGWATWQRGWQLFEKSGQILLDEIQSKGLQKKFDIQNAYPYTQMLQDQINGKTNSWAIRWYASTFLQKKLSLCPFQSLVYHNGNDGSGTNFGSSNLLDIQLYIEPIKINEIPVCANKAGYRAIERHFKSHSTQKLSKIKLITKLLLPPLFLKITKKLFKKAPQTNKYGWSGNYANWNEALLQTSGYNAESIFNKVKEATIMVKNGQAAFERDSVIFDQVQYAYPVLAGLLWVASKHNNQLNVLDFGGSLGSSYYQNNYFLLHLNQLKWNIVEQPHFVDFGQQHLSNNNLHFYHTLSECLQKNKPNVVLLSSVLQYIEKPYELLTEIIQLGTPFFILDRTPVISGKSAICVQKVDPAIYEGSYPCWLFNENELLNYFESNNYNCILNTEGNDGRYIVNGQELKFMGYLLQLTKK